MAQSLVRRALVCLFITSWLSVHAVESDKGGDEVPNKLEKITPEPFKYLPKNSFDRFGKFSEFSERDFEFDNFQIRETDDDLNIPFYNGDTQDDQYRERALQLSEYLEESGRYVDQLDATTIMDLPVGIKKTIGNIEYTIAIDSMIIHKDHASLTAYMAFKIPAKDKTLAFRGSNIAFSKEGGLVGTSRLQLVGDYGISMGSNSLLILKGEGNTFVEWDCDGFKSMGLDAEIEFSRDLFVPDNPDGSKGEGRVRARFTTAELSSWDDLVAEISIPSFQITGLDGVGFTVQKAVIDYSSINQIPGITYPAGYSNDAYDPGNPNFWQGIYLGEVSVRLPKQFKNKENGERIGFAGYDIIIDDMGFSGVLEASNVLSNGSMDEWPFTVDKFRVSVIANQIQGAGFEGLVTVPVDKENPFEYTAIINPGNEYIFGISPSKNLTFDFIKASEVTLHESSSLEVRLANNEFKPKAILHGELSINAEAAKLKSIEFQSLEIQSVKPYVKLGGFALGFEGMDQNLGSFQIGLNRIGSVKMDDPDELGILFDMTVKLIGEDEGAFGGDGGFIVVGDVGSSNFEFKRVEITKIGVAMNTGAVNLAATLEWFENDNIYGDGIRGDATVDVIEVIKVDAVALFGKQNNMRFWFFDALATLPPGSGAAGLELTSFGGGAFYHMKQAGVGESSSLGESVTGIVYTPDAQTYMGLKATVNMQTIGSPALFNGDATLEISFNQGGGIRMIDFKGNGYFLTPTVSVNLGGLKERAGGLAAGAAQGALNQLNPEAQIAAHLHINYDVPNKTLHGNFEVYVKMIGGVMKGIGANNRAGWVVVHFEPGEWYVHAGSPDDPLGVEMIKILKTKSYFMMGDYIPGSPPPPERVSKILGGLDLDYMADLNELASGKGVAFGSRVEFDTGNITFMMFYARLAAGLGFDLMLKDYGSASCVGGSGPIGINGWYANGQAFGYFDGEIGISVKILRKRRKVNILSLSAAVLMQAKLPNPLWIRGIVGGHFNVLGGLVKGNCRFEVTIGEECQIQGGSVLEGIEVIAEVTPGEGEKDVSVFNAAQAVFNLQINKEFEMVDLDEVKKSFRIKLDHFKVMDGGSNVVGTLEWNDNSDVVAFNPTEILPPNKSLQASAQVSFEVKQAGIWEPVKVDGDIYREELQTTFITGEAPDYIPLENVAYSYPVIDQTNFYKDEHSQGYIKLKVGQGYLFYNDSEWVQKGRLRSEVGSTPYFNVAYSNQQITFALPKNLSTDKIYALEILDVPVAAAEQIDANVSEVTKAVADTGQGLMEITSNEAEGSLDLLQEEAIYAAYFRTSSFNKFSDKLNSISISHGWSWPIYTGIHELGVNIQGAELFSYHEVNEFRESDPLVQFEARLSDNNWYQTYIRSLVYPSYPAYGLEIEWREPLGFGVPPAKAIYVNQEPTESKLASGEGFNNTFESLSGQGVFVYNLPYVMYQDYYDYRNQIAEQLLENKNSWFNRLANTPYPGIRTGNYKMSIKYVLPGRNTVITSKEINIYVN